MYKLAKVILKSIRLTENNIIDVSDTVIHSLNMKPDY